MIFMDKTEWKASDDALKRKEDELRALAAIFRSVSASAHGDRHGGG